MAPTDTPTTTEAATANPVSAALHHAAREYANAVAAHYSNRDIERTTEGARVASVEARVVKLERDRAEVRVAEIVAAVSHCYTVDDIAGAFDIDAVATEVAARIDTCDIAAYVDAADVAAEVDASDIADHIDIDASEVAGHLDASDIAAEMDVAEVVAEMNIDAIADSVAALICGRYNGHNTTTTDAVAALRLAAQGAAEAVERNAKADAAEALAAYDPNTPIGWADSEAATVGEIVRGVAPERYTTDVVRMAALALLRRAGVTANVAKAIELLIT